MVALLRRRCHKPPRALRMYPGAGVVPPHSQPPCCAVSNAELPSAPLPSLLLPPSLLPPPPLLLATLPVPAALTASDRLRKSALFAEEYCGSEAVTTSAAAAAASATCSAAPAIPLTAGVNAHHGVALANTIPRDMRGCKAANEAATKPPRLLPTTNTASPMFSSTKCFTCSVHRSTLYARPCGSRGHDRPCPMKSIAQTLCPCCARLCMQSSKWKHPTPNPCSRSTGGPALSSPMRQKCTRGLHGWSHSHHCECGSSTMLSCCTSSPTAIAVLPVFSSSALLLCAALHETWRALQRTELLQERCSECTPLPCFTCRCPC
mmetsp:Transcript_21170/g.63712  ORF Transcript_21170/g.63712 Transcript_21170/m.63712 type:complete len:320 (+) Transcript_21170:856-1815(+)